MRSVKGTPWGLPPRRGPSTVNIRIEQLRMFCKHYNVDTVVQRGGCCNANVRYMAIGPTLAERPCFNGQYRGDPTATCPKWERVSREEAEKQYKMEVVAFGKIILGELKHAKG